MNRFVETLLPTVLLILSHVVLGAECPRGDLNDDCRVDWADVEVIADSWLHPDCLISDCSADLDGIAGVDLGDFSLLAQDWLQDYSRIVYIQWLGHASFRIEHLDSVIYIDPRNLSSAPHDATIVLVTHSHGDHYSPTDIAKIAGPTTVLIAPADVVASQGWGQPITPGQTIDLGTVSVIGIAAYNITKQYHLKSRNWVGFVIELGPQRIYNAGDTDLTEEMKAVREIDVAILPVGGTYTMDSAEAADATSYIQSGLAIPAHWGDIIGTRSDAENFAAHAHCDVTIMDVGQTIISGP